MLVTDVFDPTLMADLMVWASPTRATRCPHFPTDTFHVPRANWSMQRLSQDWMGLSFLQVKTRHGDPVFSVVETFGAL